MADKKTTKKKSTATKKKKLSNNPSKTFTFKIDLVMILWALVALNVLTIFLWKPWQNNGAPERKISVTGEAVLEAEPDLYKFNPSYNIEGSSQDDVLKKAANKANEVVDGLKLLGIEDKDIKIDANSYGRWWYDEDTNKSVTSVYVSVEVHDKDMAQDVQDFLLTTQPEGQITPWPTFSEEKQKELEIEARELAIADAKQKAEQSASKLGLEVGRVITVSEGYGLDAIEYGIAEPALDSTVSVKESIPIQPGQNEYRFSVTVVFEIK